MAGISKISEKEAHRELKTYASEVHRNNDYFLMKQLAKSRPLNWNIAP